MFDAAFARGDGCLKEKKEWCVLSAQLHQPGGEACDLADGAQDVVSLLGVFAQIGNAFGLCQQRSDVLFSLGTTVRICQPSLGK